MTRRRGSGGAERVERGATEETAVNHTLQSLTEIELRDRMLARHEGAWREFHRRYDRLVWMQIHRLASAFPRALTPADLEEIHANLYAALLANEMHRLRYWEPSKGTKLATWIALLSTNIARDYLRAVKRRPGSSPIESHATTLRSEADPADHATVRQTCDRLRDALGGMSERDRSVLFRLYVEEATPDEIAREFGMSVKTIYTRTHRIRHALRRRMGDRIAA